MRNTGRFMLRVVVYILFFGSTLFFAGFFSDRLSAASISPGASIQSAMQSATSGEVITVENGVYNESLSLPSGTPASPITLKCASSLGCTITSLQTGGRVDNWIVEGFRILGGVNLAHGAPWSADTSATSNGNNNIIIRNNYIEGSVLVYGHNNRIEHNEVNGKGSSGYGIHEQYAASYNNTFINNTVHDFNRGIWSMNMTRNTVISGNTIYNIVHSAINCDGFKYPVRNCKVENNTIANAKEIGIFLENTFDSSITGNTITCDSDYGFFIRNYGMGADWKSSAEFRGTNTNSILQNNSVCGKRNGIYALSSPGWRATNNTIRSVSTSGYSAVGLLSNDGYGTNGWLFQQNTIQCPTTAITFNGAQLTSDTNVFVEAAPKFLYNGASRTYAQWQAAGYDTHSTTANQSVPTTGVSPTGVPTNVPTVRPSPTFVPTPIPTPTPKPGDADGDGKANEADYRIWKSNYRKPGISGAAVGDFTMDGVVSGVDYALWLLHYQP